MAQAILERTGTDHHQVDVAPGGTIRANKRWRNVGAAGNRDILVAYGTGTTVATFLMEFGALAIDQFCPAAAEVVTPVDSRVPTTATGLKNALVGVGTYDPTTSVIAFDDYDIVANAINVAGAPPPGEAKGEQVSVAFVAL